MKLSGETRKQHGVFARFVGIVDADKHVFEVYDVSAYGDKKLTIQITSSRKNHNMYPSAEKYHRGPVRCRALLYQAAVSDQLSAISQKLIAER